MKFILDLKVTRRLQKEELHEAITVETDRNRIRLADDDECVEERHDETFLSEPEQETQSTFEKV